MAWLYERVLRPALFSLEPEQAHTLTEALLHRVGPWIPSKGLHQPIQLMGLDLPNPIGLAAGLDKNGLCLAAWKALGFGFVEVGTVTPRPQPGNPKPRLFRLPAHSAIINRLGFNSLGMEAVGQHMKNRPHDLVVGINMGKNKDTPLEEAANDYLAVMTHLFSVADYFTVNISSPNTPGLRVLQEKAFLEPLLLQLKESLFQLNQKHHTQKPLVVKIAPDLCEETIVGMAESFISCQIDGIIATNTTVDHQRVKDDPQGHEEGGLSGQPLFSASTHVLKILAEQLQNRIPLIGVGGITDKASAEAKFKAGAKAIQLYTGFVYKGPALIRECVGEEIMPSN